MPTVRARGISNPEERRIVTGPESARKGRRRALGNRERRLRNEKVHIGCSDACTGLRTGGGAGRPAGGGEPGAVGRGQHHRTLVSALGESVSCPRGRAGGFSE